MSLIEELKKETQQKPDGRPNARVYRFRGFRFHYAEPPILAKAYGVANLFRETPAHIYDNDLIAGSIRGLFLETVDERERNKAEHDFFMYGFNHFLTNADHFAPDYRTFLKDGIPGTLKRVEESKKAHTDEKSQRFLRSVEIVLGGFSDMLEAYALSADKKYKETNEPRFSVMAEDLRFLQKNAPACFRQALQLVFLTYIAFVFEGKDAMALGRIDQYLYPFYKKDVEAGLLTDEQATELLTATFLKIGEHRFFGGDDTVNICIGGVTPEGEEGINELSYCCLAAVKTANIPGPNLSARLHSGMPDRFLDECLKVIATGLGYPALMNDDVNIPALSRHGYALEDVRDYCFVGCIENFISGKQPPWSDARFNVPIYFEPIFFRGKMIRSKTEIGIDTGDLASLDTMDKFIDAFKAQMHYGFSEYYANFNSENDRYNPENYSQPFLSVFCQDCIGRAKDVRDGGAKYASMHGPGCMGIATVADSLAAIEKYIYNEKKYTLQELADAIAADFVGYEELQKDLLSAPKYGNDDDFVDKYAVWFVHVMENEIFKGYHTRDGGDMYAGIASNIQNISAGTEVAATPDGRKAGEPLSDAASPMHGMDYKGITAVINSTTKPDFTQVSCGTVLNQKFSPSMLQKEENRKKVLSALKVYFQKGGQEMQINSVSRDILKDAMKNPENYRNLVVRVSGFSAYYTCLDREVQLDILKRTEHDS